MPFRTIFFLAILFVYASTTVIAANQNLPACDTQVLTRQGNDISIGLDALTKSLNDKLIAAHSGFSQLQLTSEGGNLKIAGKKNSTPMSISGPLQVTGHGRLQVHANQIHDGGAGVTGIMGVFGENLSDYVNLKRTGSMSVQGNDLRINPNKLLGLRGRATKVKLQKSSIEVRFASQPCRALPAGD